MKSMAEEIQKQFPKSLLDKINKIENEVLNHPLIIKLKEKYPDHFNKENINAFSSNQLLNLTQEYNHCKSCQGLEGCKNDLKGYRSIVQEDEILGPKIVYSPCDLQKGWEYQQKIKKHIQSHHVPDHILKTTFQDLEMDTRKEVIKAAMRFCATFKRGITTTGLYLHGRMGYGKSAIAGAMTNELAKRGIDVIMVYVPDFMEEVKDSIQSGGMTEKLNTMKKVSVLILDDIGAESLSPWTRDNVLGAILNDRMQKLPTVYTSNLSLNELRDHLMKAKGKSEGENSRVKAERIMERIEPFVDCYHVLSTNWRRKK